MSLVQIQFFNVCEQLEIFLDIDFKIHTPVCIHDTLLVLPVSFTFHISFLFSSSAVNLTTSHLIFGGVNNCYDIIKKWQICTLTDK